MTITTKKVADAKDANTDTLKKATEFAASGAVIEPTIVERVDMSHPSVDDNPRAGTSPDMNRIDFNEPSALTPQEEAVEENLKSGD